MSTATIRQKLHSHLEIADDKKVKAIYAIMENEIEGSALEYSDEIKKNLICIMRIIKAVKQKWLQPAKAASG
jgi:hypothetical protein